MLSLSFSSIMDATGYFQDLEGKEACYACPVGKVATGKGNKRCKDCEAGKANGCMPPVISNTAVF